MNVKLTLILLSAILLLATACHIRKDSHRKQQVDKDTAVPANGQQQMDMTTHTPTAKFTPASAIAPNVRPKPVPEPKPPVPPL